jgi:hypothetical protein
VRVRLTLIAALLLALLPAAPASARDRCSPRGSKTVKQKGSVRVYTTPRKHGSVYYGCLRGSRRPVRLTESLRDPQSFTSATVGRIVIAGSSVAVVTEGFEDIGVDGNDTESIVVADLRRGGRLYRTGYGTNDDSQYSALVTLLVRADGAAAWAIKSNGGYFEVDVLGPAAARATPVAYAKGVDPKSLAFGGDGVTWVDGGVTRSAAIP